ncbi:hypothetical protein MXB_1371 [Myxobolus squamalis]|nr:hypothetical protein MXB_1371 [Myxobolus squamalis]
MNMFRTTGYQLTVLIHIQQDMNIAKEIIPIRYIYYLVIDNKKSRDGNILLEDFFRWINTY